MNTAAKPAAANGKLFAVAPMMGWTDRHCRFFHRRLTRHALLYTEMITAQAILRGDRARLLAHDPEEHPIALQLGGSDPATLAEAARIGEAFGYCEINLNVGCPSDRVQEGRFGACLMAEPEFVGRCTMAMIKAVRIPVTIKCRIGIDAQQPEEALPRFVGIVAEAGCRTFIVHARKAWLQGLSPKQNREVPPLDYELVHWLKDEFPHLRIILNGGLADIVNDISHLSDVDGLMYGRTAYHDPWMLSRIDPLAASCAPPVASRFEVVTAMRPYIEAQMRQGEPLHRITRHMLGLFHGQPGGRQWRKIISEQAHQPGSGFDVLNRAVVAIEQHGAAFAAAET
jgi:tRNA-dihydrouridine synthase A